MFPISYQVFKYSSVTLHPARVYVVAVHIFAQVEYHQLSDCSHQLGCSHYHINTPLHLQGYTPHTAHRIQPNVIQPTLVAAAIAASPVSALRKLLQLASASLTCRDPIGRDAFGGLEQSSQPIWLRCIERAALILLKYPWISINPPHH